MGEGAIELAIGCSAEIARGRLNFIQFQVSDQTSPTWYKVQALPNLTTHHHLMLIYTCL